GTNYGKQVMTGNWFDTEFVAMRKLWLAGADIPYPLSGGGGVMVMQFIGDWDRAAPRLIDARIEREKAEPLLEQILWNVRLLAREETVHGDLSAYNVLFWEERAWIIDFPQSVNLFHNQYGVEFLLRDIVNVCNFFKRFGIVRDPQEELALALAEAYG
ncbi:MAG: RIO1 family regulatory kinase/ATPase, partial [Actinomycetota bacterium]